MKAFLSKSLLVYTVKILLQGDFPGAPVVKNLPCHAGDVGLILGQETKVPHAMEQPSHNSGACVTTGEFNCRNRGPPCCN